MIEKKWLEQGFIDEPIPERTDVKAEIRRMCKEKNALIMAHYYTEGVIQELADFVGDSLALAQKAATTEADIIVMCGVHFMGETNKILCPEKTILVPDLNASCSLAESCPADEFEKFVKAHPNHTVVSYVNTTAATKAVTDVVVTSSNAKQIVESLPKDTPIIFGPDKNLGHYISEQTGRKMLLWDGVCEVHDRFSVEKIQQLKREHPAAKVLAHPECPPTVLCLADKVGMQRLAPQKTFIPAPPNDSDSPCNECEYMKYITLRKLYNCLKYEWPSIEVEPEMAKRAVKSIHRMLDISNKLGL